MPCALRAFRASICAWPVPYIAAAVSASICVSYLPPPVEAPVGSRSAKAGAERPAMENADAAVDRTCRREDTLLLLLLLLIRLLVLVPVLVLVLLSADMVTVAKCLLGKLFSARCVATKAVVADARARRRAVRRVLAMVNEEKG